MFYLVLIVLKLNMQIPLAFSVQTLYDIRLWILSAKVKYISTSWSTELLLEYFQASVWLLAVALKISCNRRGIVSCFKYGAVFDYSMLLCPFSMSADSYLRI